MILYENIVCYNNIVIGDLKHVPFAGSRTKVRKRERERRERQRKNLLDGKRLFLFLLFDPAIIGFIVVHHVVCFHNCVGVCPRACAHTHNNTQTNSYTLYIYTHTDTIMGH